MRIKLLLTNLEKSKVEGYRDGRHALYAWGASDFIGDENDEEGGRSNNYSLKFSVSTKKFNGNVKILGQAFNRFNIYFEQFNHETGSKMIVHQLDKVPLEAIMSQIDSFVEPQTDKPQTSEYYYTDDNLKENTFVNIKIDEKEFNPIKWVEKFNQLLAQNDNRIGPWLENFLENIYLAGVDKSKSIKLKTVRTMGGKKRGRPRKNLVKAKKKKNKSIIFVDEI